MKHFKITKNSSIYFGFMSIDKVAGDIAILPTLLLTYFTPDEIGVSRHTEVTFHWINFVFGFCHRKSYKIDQSDEIIQHPEY